MRESRSPDALPSVSVIISELNSERTLSPCLESVLGQDYPCDKFEVIVVDGGSSDGSLQILERFKHPNLRVAVVPRCSETGGQIFALGLSTGEIIMFTNSDVYVPSDWIRRHVAWQGMSYDLVGGSVVWGGDKFALAWNPSPSLNPTHLLVPGQGLGFNNCSVSRSMLERSGGLREMISQQDVEFAFRVLGVGGRLILDPTISVYHDHPFRSLRESFSRAFGFAHNQILVMRQRAQANGATKSFVSVPEFLTSVGGEVLLVGGLRAFRRIQPAAAEHGIRVGLAEFLWIRFLIVGIARQAGMMTAFLRQKKSLGALVNMHTDQQKRPESRAPALGRDILSASPPEQAH